MYTQSVKYHKYKYGFKCLREMGMLFHHKQILEKSFVFAVIWICVPIMCSHYAQQVLGRFNL